MLKMLKSEHSTTFFNKCTWFLNHIYYFIITIIIFLNLFLIQNNQENICMHELPDLTCQ